jgi:hypothetical protein
LQYSSMSGSIILVSYLPDAPAFTRKWVNEAYCIFFGVCPEDVIGFSCLESTREDRRSDVRKKSSLIPSKDTVESLH